jgi:hypothetical protein
MVTDKNLYMSDQQSLVAAVGVIYSERTIKFDAPQAIPQLGTGTGGPHDVGAGNEVEVVVEVNEAFTSTSSDGTVKAELIMADSEDLLTNPVILQSSQAIVCPALGYQFRLGGTLPIGITKNYLGIKYTTAVHDPTAGKVSAFLTPTRQTTNVG